MITETEHTLTAHDTIEEVEYPPEVVGRWKKEVEIVRAQIATGQAKLYRDVKDLFLDLEKDDD